MENLKEIVEYFTNTKNIRRKYSINAEGLNHGLFVNYHKNGSISKKSNWIDGRRNGLFEVYHENGKIRLRTNLVDEVENGLVEEFYENKSVILHKINGVLNGLFEIYEDNMLIISGVNVNNASGKLNCELSMWFNDVRNNIYLTKTHYINNIKNGVETIYYTSGEIYMVINYENGLKNGVETIYHENGSIKSTVKYENGFMRGLHISYDKTGEITFENYYDRKSKCF